jgi:YebC/PmpR family DNA-binding regulatory protein
MPHDKIDYAIKKGAGELEGQALEELSYEAYAPGGVAMMIDCLSDNRNRTSADIRHILSRSNVEMAQNGSVSFLFERKARMVIEGEHADEEKLMDLFFEAEIEIDDIDVDDDVAEVTAPPECYDDMAAALSDAGITPSESGVVRIAETLVPVTDLKTAKQVTQLIDALEDHDDVQNVNLNADYTDEVLEALAAE